MFYKLWNRLVEFLVAVFERECLYRRQQWGAFAYNAWYSAYTRALRAQLYDRPEAFASEMPCAPAARWLAHSVRAWRQGAHVDTTTACSAVKLLVHQWGLLTASVLVPLLQGGSDQDKEGAVGRRSSTACVQKASTGIKTSGASEPRKGRHSEQANPIPSQGACTCCTRCVFVCARKGSTKEKCSGATRARSLCFIYVRHSITEEKSSRSSLWRFASCPRHCTGSTQPHECFF